MLFYFSFVANTEHNISSLEFLEVTFQSLKGRFKFDFAIVLRILLHKYDVATIKEFLMKEYPQIVEARSIVTIKDLIIFMSKFCFFSCFGLLAEVTTCFKNHKAQLILERFTDDRTKWYKQVPASDFAKEGLKDDDVITDNRIEV